jgi:hypothetical protein
LVRLPVLSYDLINLALLLRLSGIRLINLWVFLRDVERLIPHVWAVESRCRSHQPRNHRSKKNRRYFEIRGQVALTLRRRILELVKQLLRDIPRYFRQVVAPLGFMRR